MPAKRLKAAYTHLPSWRARYKPNRKQISPQNARKNIELGKSVYFKKRMQPLLVDSIFPLIKGRKLLGLVMIRERVNVPLFTAPLK